MAETPEPKPPESWPYAWQAPFLAALRNSANIRIACQAAEISRQLAYKIRKQSARFASAWDDAINDAIDTLEAAAWQRARSQSDYLLWRLLAAHRRELYGDNVKVTLDLESEARKIAEREGLPPEQAAKIVSLAERLKAGKAG